MKFTYKAINSNAVLVAGEIQADSVRDAEEKLRRENLKIVSLQTEKRRLKLSVQRRLSAERLSILFSQMSLMLSGGLGIATVLKLIEKNAKSYEKKIIGELAAYLESGKLLSEAVLLTGAFPPYVSGMIKSGESAGRLSTVFDELAVFFQEEHAMKQKMLNALAYPVILMITSVVVLNIVLQTVLPVFTEVFSNDHAQLPATTRLLIAVSEHLNRFGSVYLLIFSFAVLLFIFLKNYGKTKKSVEKMLYHLPPLKPFYKDLFELRFLRTMKMQIDNGVDMLQILENGEASETNSYKGDRLQEVKKHLIRGDNLSLAMEKSNLFKKEICTYISLGEESSALSDMLAIAIQMEDYRQKNRAERIAVYIEPTLIIFMALIVGFIIFSIAIPMFDMVNHF
ncbi:bacterial type II secretion system protein F domain protein [Aedoeadaptatus coxii]|uniref:type II secretion system F family protein n=1 Tax=Aedoeadaptatus coxii TaxID=755172 RepID=UPI0017693DBA|nr:type II secretion system F family protein [Peptoniphilus coxii]CAC9930596.1 bacterial type II secretion system protein F domain protein [Peptoniphilus coxii]